MENALQAVRSSRPAVAAVIAASLAIVVLCGVGVAAMLGWTRNPPPPPGPTSVATPSANVPATPQQAGRAAGPDGLEPNESIVEAPEFIAPPLQAPPMMPAYVNPSPPRAAPAPRRVSPPVALAPGNSTPAYTAPAPLAPRAQVQRASPPPAAPAPTTPHYIRIRPHPTDPNDPWPN
ncbi:MAG: hypothetical protein ABIQ72_15855 [Usitatibacter sp.]